MCHENKYSFYEIMHYTRPKIDNILILGVDIVYKDIHNEEKHKGILVAYAMRNKTYGSRGHLLGGVSRFWYYMGMGIELGW